MSSQGFKRLKKKTHSGGGNGRSVYSKNSRTRKQKISQCMTSCSTWSTAGTKPFEMATCAIFLIV